MLSAGLPVKVLVQTDDLLEESSIGTGHFAFGVRSARLATTAMGLGGMFVLQSTERRTCTRCASACAARHDRAAARRCSASSRAPATAAILPPYLTAAAAMESRAFPAFTYDAAAGDNWAEPLFAGEQSATRTPTGRPRRSSTPTKRCSA